MYSQLILRLKEKEKELNKIPKQEFVCSECGSYMIRRKDKFRENKFWWGCSNYPRCTNTFNE